MLKRLLKIIVIFAIFRGLTSYFVYRIPSKSMIPTLLVNDFILADRFAYNAKLPYSAETVARLNKAARGDIVIYKDPVTQQDFIKRIIGIEGDHIAYDQRSGEIKITPFYELKNCKQNPCAVKSYSYSNETLSSEVLFSSNGEKLALIERTEQGDVSHQILLSKVRYNMAKYFFKQEGLPAGEWIVPMGQYFVMGDNRDNSNDSRFLGFIPHDNLVGKVSTVLFNPSQENRALKTIQ